METTSADFLEQVVDAFEAAMRSDITALRRIGSTVAKELDGSGNESQAKRLRVVLRKRASPLRTSGHVEHLPSDPKSRLSLLDEVPPPSVAVLLNGDNERMANKFVADCMHAEQLAQEGVGSGLRILLTGPPGTGKTLLAGHIAARLGRPLYMARLDATVSSLLGDTAKNIRSIFDHISQKTQLVFLDEIDAIAKRRDDSQELGELKRVVNTLLQGLDDLDDSTVVIAATNHPSLLDPAVWRRFPYRIEMGLPDRDLRRALWEQYLPTDIDKSVMDLLAAVTEGLAPSDIRELAFAGRRTSIVEKTPYRVDDLMRSLCNLSSGRLSLPVGGELTVHEKKELAVWLKTFGPTNVSIASALSTSRQTVDAYLKSPLIEDAENG